ncbi:MAG: dTDP-4-dehydrorhamnose reductase [Xanthobacteraceae bacterium]|jgi:dTDP-4-dehydrorhamnose reductase
MRLMVTGVTGQVGGALLKLPLPADTVIAAGRDQLDLAKPDRIAAALDHFGPDLIINPAAYTAVDRAEDEKELAFSVNAEAPAAIARWAADRGVPLIHFSTDYVFDGTGSRPWREIDPANPLSVYGASKYAGENAVRTAGGPHLIIRTSWIYAAHGTNFLRTIVRLAKERRELRIVADQVGAPTSAALIAHAVASIVGTDRTALAGRFSESQGLVNVAASGETSWYGFAVAIVEGLKARGVSLAVESIAEIATKDYPTTAKRPANSRLDLTRLGRAFGIEPSKWDLALGIELDQLADDLTSSEQSF